MVWQIKKEHGAAANCSPYDASLGLKAADSACQTDLWPQRGERERETDEGVREEDLQE